MYISATECKHLWLDTVGNLLTASGDPADLQHDNQLLLPLVSQYQLPMLIQGMVKDDNLLPDTLLRLL